MKTNKEKVAEFLNAKSMLTPGICGAVTMTITNAVSAAFDFEGPGRAFLCLGLSFLVGTLVFAANVKVLWQKLVFYVLNSLIIFSTAAGVNMAGQAATKGNTSEAAPETVADQQPKPAATPAKTATPGTVGPTAHAVTIRSPIFNPSTNMMLRSTATPAGPSPVSPLPAAHTNTVATTNIIPRLQTIKLKTGSRFFGRWH